MLEHRVDKGSGFQRCPSSRTWARIVTLGAAMNYSDRMPPQESVETVAVRAAPEAVTVGAVPPASAGSGTIAPAPTPTPPDIVMYLSPRCGYCVKAARFFDQRGVPFRGLDITSSEYARLQFEQAGGRGTPLIFVDGERVSGFNQPRLDALLAARGF